MSTSNGQTEHGWGGLESLLSGVPADIAAILAKPLEGREVTVEEGTRLFEADGPALLALMATADELRRQVNGDRVTYVVNRNINFTNVCIKRCGFCAFSRDFRQEEGYFLPLNEIIRRAQEASDLGATEVCIQAGLPPKMDGSLYIDLTRELKAELPHLHIHGFCSGRGCSTCCAAARAAPIEIIPPARPPRRRGVGRLRTSAQ